MPLTPEQRKELEQLRAELGVTHSSEITSPTVVQEQHPDIGFGTRALLKNLATGPEASIAYLKKKGLEADVINDQVVARRPGEKEWRVLDPSGFDIQDISDVAGDIAGGAATGVATAAGGLAGGALGAPTGVGAAPAAIAGGAAAGSAASAGIEALRQKAGQLAGIPQELDTGQIKTAGIVGAASPLLLGTGATVGKGLAAKLAARATGGTIEPTLQAAQAGLLQKGFQKTKEALPTVGEYFTGVPRTATKAFMKNKAQVQELASPEATLEFQEQAFEKLQDGLMQAKQRVGEKLKKEIDSANVMVNTQDIKQPIDDYIAKLEQSEIGKSPAVLERIAQFKKVRDGIFTQATGQLDEQGNQVLQELPSQMKASDAFELQDLLKDLGDLRSYTQDLKAGGAKISAPEKAFVRASRDAYQNVNKELSRVTGGASSSLKSEYKDFSQLQRTLASRFRDPEKTGKTLANIEAPANRSTKDLLERLRKMTDGKADLTKEAEVLQASRFYNQPAWQELTGTGTTGTSRRAIATLLGGSIGFKIGGPLGLALGGAAGGALASPAAMKYGYIPAARTAGKVLETGGEMVRPYAVPATQSIWEMLQRRGE